MILFIVLLNLNYVNYLPYVKHLINNNWFKSENASNIQVILP